jgi:hypothetical protein
MINQAQRTFHKIHNLYLHQEMREIAVKNLTMILLKTLNLYLSKRQIRKK